MQPEELILKIKEAFKNIRLEDGVGLSEADAIDDYKEDAFIKSCREKDERENWQNISTEDLNKYYCAWTYLDAKGIQFHLPALLICMLNHSYRFDLPYPLTDASGNSAHLFSLFTKEQKATVKLFLVYLMTTNDYKPEASSIENLIEKFWSN